MDTEKEKESRKQLKEARKKMRDMLMEHLQQLKDHIQCSDDRRKISKLRRLVQNIDPDMQINTQGDRNLCDLLENKNDVLLQVITSPDCHNVYGIDMYGNKFLKDKLPASETKPKPKLKEKPEYKSGVEAIQVTRPQEENKYDDSESEDDTDSDSD